MMLTLLTVLVVAQTRLLVMIFYKLSKAVQAVRHAQS